MEVVMPLKVEISSLRVLMESDQEEVDWVRIRYEQLNMINKKRLAAIFMVIILSEQDLYERVWVERIRNCCHLSMKPK
jgi:hypothetical protein